MALYTPEELQEKAARVKEIRDDHPLGSKERVKALVELFPSDLHSSEFFKWERDNVVSKLYPERQKQTVPTAAQFISMIDNVDLNSTEQVEHLDEILNLRVMPYIAVGSLQGYRYRLSPATFALCSDGATNHSIPNGYRLLSKTFLGICTDSSHGSPAESDQDTDSDKESSTSSKRCDSKVTPPNPPQSLTGSSALETFVVKQLGLLEYYPSSRELSARELVNSNWLNTKFVVVVKVQRDGTHGDIYIVYNDNPFCDDCGDRHNDSGLKEGGYLPTKRDVIAPTEDDLGDKKEHNLDGEQADSRIHCAKIATKFEHLCHGKEIEVVPVAGKMTKLTRVLISPNDGFLGQNELEKTLT